MSSVPLQLFLFTLYVRPQDWVPGMVGFPTAMVLLPIALAIAIANRFKDPAKFRAPQNWVLPLYVATIFVSTLVNVGIDQAVFQVDLFLRRIAVFYVIAWTLTSSKAVSRIVITTMCLTAFLAFQAYLQASTGEAWGGLTTFPGYEEIRVRWYGDWDGPNVFGILFVVALGFALEYTFGPHNIARKLFAAASGLAFLIGVYFTNSRGAVLAIAAMSFFYFRNRFRSIFAIVLILLALLALAALGPSRMVEVNSKESSAHERTWLWEQGLVLLKENPALGVGRGEFHKRVSPALIAHNNYVQNFAETGLVGFFFFVSLLWFSFKGNYLLTSERYAVSSRSKSLGRMMNSVLVGYCAATFFVVMELDVFFVVLGLCVASYLSAAREHASLPPLEFTMKDLAAIVAIMSALIFMIWLAAVKHIV